MHNDKICFRRWIATVVLILLGVHLNSSQAQPVSVEQITGQIQEIDNSVRTLESEQVASEAKVGQLDQDSIRITTEHQNTHSVLQGKGRLIDEQIAAKNNEISTLKKQISALVNDSNLAQQTFRAERSGLQAKIKQFEQLINTSDAEIASLTLRRQQLSTYAAQVSDPQGPQLLAEKQKIDNMLAAQQEQINGLHSRRTALVNDSSAQMTAMLTMQSADKAAQQNAVSELQSADAIVASAKSALSQARGVMAEKKNVINSAIQGFLSHKASLAASATQTLSRLKNLETELAKLQASAGALQAKYEAGRAPLASQIVTVNQIIQTREQQKVIWSVMKEKYVIDSSVSVARNQLDDLIQQSATGKRGAKKLIEEKENELNVLLGKKENFLNAPGVRQVDAQLATMTLSQQRMRIEQVLKNIEEDISRQTTLKVQTESALSQYDASNPIGNDPSIRRFRQVDSMTNVERLNSGYSKASIDSVDFIIKSYKDSITSLEVASRNELALYENELNSSMAQKNGIIVKMEQLKKASQDALMKSNVLFTKVVTEIRAINQKIALIERDIGVSQGQSANAQNRIVISQQKFEQMKASANQEVGTIDLQIAEKQRGKAELANQSSSCLTQIQKLESDIQQKNSIVSASIQSTNGTIVLKNSELQNLLSQRSGVLVEIDGAQKQAGSDLMSVRSAKVNLLKRNSAIVIEMNTLKSRRAMHVRTIQDKVAALSRSVEFAKGEVEKTSTSYNTTVQDSITNETTRESVYRQIKALMVQQDSLLSVTAVQLQMASTELAQARIDSGAAVAAAVSSMQPHQRKIRDIDSVIIVKERELASLRLQRNQVVADSNAASSISRTTIAQAQSLVRQKNDAIVALEMQSAVQTKEKKRLESDAIAKGEQFKNSSFAISAKLGNYLQQIAGYKQKVEQLQFELQSTEQALSGINGNPVSVQRVAAPSSSVNNNNDAQAVIEKIYTLIGENRMSEAQAIFTANKKELQKFASPDAFQMLLSSF